MIYNKGNMIIRKITERKNRILGGFIAALMALALLTPARVSNAQPANLSPDLQEIVKFAQAHMTDDVILTYIKNSGKSYNLSGDDMLYLSSQGVSQAVIDALLLTKGAPAPAPAPAPEPAPAPAPAPAPGLVDIFTSDAALNPSVWQIQTPLILSLAQWNTSAPMPPMLAFGPTGMQMSGVNGAGQFTGIQSAASFMAPFTLTTTVNGLAAEGVPFDVYLVSPDLRQWFSVAGHLGGMGDRHEVVGVRTPFGGFRVPAGREPSPEYGVWANWTGSAQPISALGSKIFAAPVPGVPYTITMTVGPDGIGSVVLQDPAGVSLGLLNAMPVGTGPFNIVLASRRFGPTFASWQSVQLTPASPPPAAPVVITAPPEVPTLDYFQAHLTPYGQWVDVPGVGTAWIPAEANVPGWRPYMNAGHWDYTDAGWFWRSDYAWGDMAFHYGRWVNNDFTGGRWGWVPGYNWAPSWVSWREGEGGMGWAPLPWDCEFRVGVGLWWHGGAVVEGVGFGLGFGAFVFVGNDHFWGGNYNVYVYDNERARVFYEHTTIHVGYRVEGGHIVAEGLGREHIAQVTHHPVEVHKVAELRHEEEHHNFEKRTAEHKELARVTVHPHETPHPGAKPGEHGTTAERGREPARPGETKPGVKPGTPAEHGREPARPETKPGTPAKSGEHAPTPAERKPNEPATHPGTTTAPGHPGTPTTGTRPGTAPATKPPVKPTTPGKPEENPKKPD
jgi:hypothetical protein